MVRPVHLLLLALALSGALPRAQGIVQGTPDSSNMFPMVCALLASNGKGGWLVSCSGTLVTPDTIVTAAHCAGTFTTVSCDPELAGTSSIIPATSTTTYPDWEETSDVLEAREDIAVVKLTQPVNRPRTAVLPRVDSTWDIYDAGQLNENSVLTVVGYGFTRDINSLPADAQTALRSQVATERHYTTAGFRALKSNKINLLTTGANGGGSVCSGDSGGTVFLGDPSSTSSNPVLVGVTSNTALGCRNDALAQRTDVRTSHNFLRKQGLPVPDE